jgi:hypothetical protein
MGRVRKPERGRGAVRLRRRPAATQAINECEGLTHLGHSATADGPGYSRGEADYLNCVSQTV